MVRRISLLCFTCVLLAASVIDTAGQALPEDARAVLPQTITQLQALPGQSAEISNLVVANREIPGLLLPALVELSGKVTIDDGTTLPPFPTALMIEAKSSTGAPVATAAGRDGVLRLPMLEGEYRFSTGALPAGYF
jgi:hypothetical protein